MYADAADRPTLVVFCRRPRLGVGKQRVAAQAGAQQALRLGELLLASAIEDAAAWPGPVVLSPAAVADSDWAGSLLAPPAVVVAQPDGNLGERLMDVDRQLRERGHGALFYIGSDAPTLDADFYARARAALEQADIVLGPAEDGGVTLMGARLPWPALADLPWSTPGLGDALAQRCRDRGLTVQWLEARYDVDTTAVLPRLCRDLATDARAARRALRQWLLAQEFAPVRAQDDAAGATGRNGVGVVIPVLGDTPVLAQLLQALAASSPPPQDILVVDGAASEACRALCLARGARYAATRAGRGHQLRYGADQAVTGVLWFLHADAQPPVDAVALITAAVRAGAAGGYFRFCFAGTPGWGKRALAALINARARVGVPYGDQGLFATRTAYAAAGGFADAPLFEEVDLVKRLRRQGSFVALDAAIGVSSRRWERDGWLRRTLENRALALAYMAGVSPQRLARHYRATPPTDRVPSPARKGQEC